jgi:hypothetical protein
VDTVSSAWIEAQRARRYRRTPQLRIQTIEEARAFVDEVGFCHFWPIKDVETPNLFHAIAGQVRSVPTAHDDPDLGKSWGWKDQSLGKRWWYYAKLLRRRATLVSLDMLPFFYACSENYGDLDDYLEEYRAGTMTAEAKQVYEALLKYGALDTVRLRRESWMSADASKSRFERALLELQVGMKVIPIGIAEVGAWHYAFIYEIVQRHFPDLPGQARQIKRSQARKVLISRYVDQAVAVDQGMIRKVFHVLNWTQIEFDRTISELRREGMLREVCVEETQDPALASARALADSPPSG